MHRTTRARGFTLIELLVVIAIIGLLATIGAVGFRSARTKARDAKRMADIRNVQTALLMYFNDHGEYPHGTYWSNSYDSPGAWIPDLVAEGYLPSLPNDPVNNMRYTFNTGNYSYTYATGPEVNYQDYVLMAQFEEQTNPNRCELKCWKFNADHAGRIGYSWCAGASGQCPNSQGYSPYLYQDH